MITRKHSKLEHFLKTQHLEKKQIKRKEGKRENDKRRHRTLKSNLKGEQSSKNSNTPDYGIKQETKPNQIHTNHIYDISSNEISPSTSD